jgi:hypothetical protein
VNLEELWPRVEGPKAKKLRLRAERRERLQANPPAAEALKKAMAWAVEIESTGIRMSLLKLPEDVKTAVLTGGAPRTIRAAMEMV